MNPKAASFDAKEIHPNDAKRKPADVVIDQPCCMFTPRVTIARVGDTIVVNNPAPVAHNFFWTSENNGNVNVVIAPKLQHRFAAPLVAEAPPIQYKCTIHPWMDGYVRIFDHPYSAVTDADGKFEIKDAPAGAYRIVYWHESVGFKDGKAGRFGDPIVIKDDGKGTMEMKPAEFEVK
jgi:plastocyanin